MSGFVNVLTIRGMFENKVHSRQSSVSCNSTWCVLTGMYPVDQTEYNNLKSALERLTLNDSSVTVHRDSSLALGAGWR